MREGFFDGGDAIHLQTLGGEAFIEKHTDAFFVVKYEDGPVLEKFGGRANGFEWDVPNVRRGRKGFGRLSNGDGQRNRESSASSGERFGPDADAIILDGDPDAVGVACEAHLDAAGVADLADGLFRIGDKIQEDLDELIGVADDAGKAGLRTEFHLDVVAAERMLVQLQSALDEAVDVERFLVRGRGARELEEILDDARGAARLPMGEFQLSLGRVIGAFPLSEKLGDAEDSGERIVQLVGDAGEHLAHGGQFFRLDELLLKAFEVSNIAAGKNHAFVLALGIPERAEIKTNPAPFTKLMADANFQGCERLAASHDVAIQHQNSGHVFGMTAVPKIHGGDFLGLEAENLFRTRADESVVGAGVEHENEIREAVDEAAGEFLLLVEAALHFAAFGDVHNRALITNNMAGVIANGSGGVQANNRCAVLADESDFAALKRGLMLDLLLEELSLGLVHENLGLFSFQQVILGIVAQHAHESGIRIQDGAFRRDDVDAFLERFKELGEASFVLAESGHVAREDGNAVNLVRAHHGVSDAIEVEHRRLALQANLDDALPMAAFHKTRHGAFHEFTPIARHI